MNADGEGAARPPSGPGVVRVRDRWTEGIRVTGADRARFLNGYLTCDVSSLAAGSGAYGFFTSAQGRILADTVVTAADGSTRLTVPVGRAAPLVEHLARYVIADRVELSPVVGETVWLLAGRGLADLAPAVLGGLPQGVGGRFRGEVAGVAVEVIRRADLAMPLCAVHVGDGDAAAVASALDAAGAAEAAAETLEALRVAAGVPRYGADFDERHFPQETGLEEAVSYTKGCYLGQEVVARIHYRGHVNHRLRRLVAEAGERLETGTPITWEGEEVGRVGSVARTPAGLLGLAIVHRKAAEPGTRVMAGDCRLRVEETGVAQTAAVR